MVMPQLPREVVRRCLEFGYPDRIPRDLWKLPWALNRYQNVMQELQLRFPVDFTHAPNVYHPSTRVVGDRHKVGTYHDEWGCVFSNIQEGVIGEVNQPLIQEISDWRKVKAPYEILPEDRDIARDKINQFCSNTDLFVLASCCPRPWERYQFLRGTENAMIDLLTPEDGPQDLLRLIHEFYMEELEFWTSTDVDAIMFMDDWGSQKSLLISPVTWRKLFKPLYKDYCDRVHARHKFIFMHSDGYIAPIIEDIIEVGVDAINSQLFCMDFRDLAKRAKGKITFWGEIDRQHVLTSPDPQVGRAAVREVAKHLYDPAGGLIAQFEFGAGTNPDTAIVIFDEWSKVGNTSEIVRL